MFLQSLHITQIQRFFKFSPINFIIIAFVLFLLIKGINASKKKEEVAAPPAGPSQEELLTQIRDLLKK
jgi:large conductance mechanosensitive channel